MIWEPLVALGGVGEGIGDGRGWQGGVACGLGRRDLAGEEGWGQEVRGRRGVEKIRWGRLMRPEQPRPARVFGCRVVVFPVCGERCRGCAVWGSCRGVGLPCARVGPLAVCWGFRRPRRGRRHHRPRCRPHAPAASTPRPTWTSPPNPSLACSTSGQGRAAFAWFTSRGICGSSRRDSSRSPETPRPAPTSAATHHAPSPRAVHRKADHDRRGDPGRGLGRDRASYEITSYLPRTRSESGKNAHRLEGAFYQCENGRQHLGSNPANGLGVSSSGEQSSSRRFDVAAIQGSPPS